MYPNSEVCACNGIAPSAQLQQCAQWFTKGLKEQVGVEDDAWRTVGQSV